METSDYEFERRVAFGQMCLATSHYRSDHHKLFKAEFGLEWRQADRFLRVSRERNVEAIKKGIPELIAESVAVCDRYIYGKLTAPADVARFVDMKAKMLGTYAPKVHKIEGGSVPIQVQHNLKSASLPELDQMEALWNQLQERAKALPSAESDTPGESVIEGEFSVLDDSQES